MTNRFRNSLDEWMKEQFGSESDVLCSSLDQLSEDQYKFCEGIVSHGDPLKAAREAELHAGQNPHLLVHLPRVAACIQLMKGKQEVELGKASSAEMLTRLQSSTVLADASLAPNTDLLAETAIMLDTLSEQDEGTLQENITLNPTEAIMQLPAVTLPQGTTIFGPEWVLERMVSVAERCLQIEPVFDRKGRPLGEFQFNANGALKALELVGKTMSMFKENVEVMHTLQEFKDGELNQRIAKLLTAHPTLMKDVVADVAAPESSQH